MLVISNLSFAIEGKPLFEGASVTIPAGHKVGIVGRNGTGKTTLFKLIKGQLAPDGGSIDVPSYFRIGGVEQEAPASDEDHGAPVRNFSHFNSQIHGFHFRILW